MLLISSFLVSILVGHVILQSFRLLVPLHFHHHIHLSGFSASFCNLYSELEPLCSSRLLFQLFFSFRASGIASTR
ncbi:uncharacterized protein BT62DRAFT_51434 [Guyanagaster necrorhizus]|uniref:Uncharacterized protein n=1 Tax=Guyanagaster necrorhizus TaxID=856835 RepID=A0A9P7W8C4_9AGAR|nr:uncharacterized protein BT62DRAFT_51434 [Guyanagaster necrorhizus MCA 3950]KAG7453206.1 hypothetical protein BT62DRAFT_51434 [Guyanagaster necrorhizus MCA 3950]